MPRVKVCHVLTEQCLQELHPESLRRTYGGYGSAEGVDVHQDELGNEEVDKVEATESDQSAHAHSPLEVDRMEDVREVFDLAHVFSWAQSTHGKIIEGSDELAKNDVHKGQSNTSCDGRDGGCGI